MLVKPFISFLFIFSLFFTDSIAASPQNSLQLYERARKHFSHTEYKQAAHLLEEVMQLHPGSKEFLNSHLLFAICQIRQNKSKNAIQPLHYYIQATNWSNESLRARIKLGHAYINEKMFHEALMVSAEILQQKKKTTIPTEVYLESLLIQAWAQLGLNKPHKALSAFDSFKNNSNDIDSIADIKTQASLFGIELRLNHCNQINHQKRQNEKSSIENLEKHGSCFLEALIEYQAALRHGSSQWVNKATFSIQRGWTDYLKACNRAPKPLQKLSKTQRSRYKNELLTLFLKTCRQNQSTVLKMLEKWGQSSSAGGRFYLEKLSKKFMKPIES